MECCWQHRHRRHRHHHPLPQLPQCWSVPPNHQCHLKRQLSPARLQGKKSLAAAWPTQVGAVQMGCMWLALINRTCRFLMLGSLKRALKVMCPRSESNRVLILGILTYGVDTVASVLCRA